MDIMGHREVTLPMVVVVGGMGEEWWIQYGSGGLGRGAEQCVVRESRQVGPGWGVYRN